MPDIAAPALRVGLRLRVTARPVLLRRRERLGIVVREVGNAIVGGADHERVGFSAAGAIRGVRAIAQGYRRLPRGPRAHRPDINLLELGEGRLHNPRQLWGVIHGEATSVDAGGIEVGQLLPATSVHDDLGQEGIPLLHQRRVRERAVRDSEFLNWGMIAWCDKHKIPTITRSRPYELNDNAHVEQRNGDWVRKHAFRYRYETDAELADLNLLWTQVRTRKNHLLPCVKAVGWKETTLT